MLKTLKKFFDFCGKENRKLFIISIRLGVVSAICSAMRIPAAAVVIKALLDNNVTVSTLWTSLGIIVVYLIVTISINMKSTMLQTKSGYRACADKHIGNLSGNSPYGIFSCRSAESDLRCGQTARRQCMGQGNSFGGIIDRDHGDNADVGDSLKDLIHSSIPP